MELPPLLSAKHVMFIMSCSRDKAYQIMKQPHRPIFQGDKGEMLRLDRDIFLEQIKSECKSAISA